MISIRYVRDGNKNEIAIDEFNCFTEEELPIKVSFIASVTGEEAWTTDLHGGTWASWSSGAVPCDMKATTRDGKPVVDEKYNVEKNGDSIEKILWYFIKLLDHRPNGLVIGSHDGTFGHWIFPTMHNLSDVLLVDGGSKQLDNAKKYYGHLDNVAFLYAVVTPDGKDVDWFESGSGYTDTVKKSVISFYLDDDVINTVHRSSISINDVISKAGKIDWLCIDAEGLDGDLILAMNTEPPLIIFEKLHLDDDTYSKTRDWFKKRGYRIMYDGVNEVIAIKN